MTVAPPALPHQTRWLRVHDQTALFVRIYGVRPPQGKASLSPQKTLLWTHGLGEHGGRYEHVIERLIEAGWRVILADLRGHGRSEGTRTHVRRFDQYAQDVETLWSALECHPERTALLGNSMGGLVTVRLLQRGIVNPAAAVLISPLLGMTVPVPWHTLLAGRVLSVIRPKTRFASRIDPANMTRDVGFRYQRDNDPLIQQSVTAGWFFAMQDALRRAWKQADRIQTPLLVFRSLSDKTVDPQVVPDWLNRTSSREKSLISRPEGLHELLQELDWRETVQDMRAWLDLRISSS